MNKYLRRSLIGVLAGAGSGSLLAHAVAPFPWCILIGIAAGAAWQTTRAPGRGVYVDNMMAAGALGVPLWGLLSLIVFPFCFGWGPGGWEPNQVIQHFPALIGWLQFGTVLGASSQALSDLAAYLFGPESPGAAAPRKEPVRIVILGGGFAGMTVAASLESEFGGNPVASVTLISETNSLLFTPMLAEVAGGSLEPSHISTPLRTSLHRTDFIRARVVAVDMERHRVILDDDREIPWDHLVLSLGAVSNYLGMANVERLAFDFKSLHDAIRIRNHVIEMFERADRETDREIRRQLLTFVIAGGGFAGVELAGALNDFANGILADYPGLSRHDLKIVLVHSRDRILPELSESLGRYAQERMAARGVVFRLNARLSDMQPGQVVLSDGEIPTGTLVWTAGTAPNPLLQTLPVERNKRGAVIVDEALAVPGHKGVWALGDCAAVVDAKTGNSCPPTAQFALREARTVAFNIHASIVGRPVRGFHFDSLGALCVVGYQTACAELAVPFVPGKSMRFSGLFAWLLWRSIYLAKLPGLERKIRVLVDWTVELFFPRDIVQTIDLK